MSILYGVITAVLLFLQAFGFKLYSKMRGIKHVNAYIVNMINFAFGAIILLIIGLATGPIDWMSMVYGLLHGVFLFGVVVFYNKAIATGKIAFCSFIIALSMLLPIVGSAVFLGEEITTMQYIGLAVFFVATYFVCFGQTADKDKIVPKRSYVFIAIAGFCNGAMALWIKIVYNVLATSPINDYQFLSAGFVVALLIVSAFALVHYAKSRKISQQANEVVAQANVSADMSDTASISPLVESQQIDGQATYINGKFWLCMVIIVVSTFGASIAFNMFSVLVEGALFYPLANGLPMILAVLVSPLFKEKLSLKSIVGVIIGVVAIVLLNL